MLDKANFGSGDSSSKLHVLTNCESYLRRLLARTRCYEMEAKLRSTARGNPDASDDTVSAAKSSSTDRGANNDAGWGNRGDEMHSSDGSNPSGETDNNFDTVDGCGGGNGACGSSSSKSSCAEYFDQEADSGCEMQGAAAGRYPGVVLAPSISGSGTGSSVDDGEMGSTDDGGGAETSLATTDSASQGFTTDTASRGFTTDSGCGDSSFGGDSGSGDSGDAASGDGGSADGGSEGSEEGGAGQRMRVVNYFDIFRLSNVPMAIASKDGTLVDVNDAMRGFGRIDQETVKTLTVQSLVAPESSKVRCEILRYYAVL